VIATKGVILLINFSNQVIYILEFVKEGDIKIIVGDLSVFLNCLCIEGGNLAILGGHVYRIPYLSI
jgi:hypothetical protein